MTQAVVRWVAGRTPAAPPALAAHVARALAAERESMPDDASAISRACLRAAERTLARVLDENETGSGAARNVALDLLTADALVTYAFEAASDAPDGLAAIAREAMATLSRVGAT